MRADGNQVPRTSKRTHELCSVAEDWDFCSGRKGKWGNEGYRAGILKFHDNSTRPSVVELQNKHAARSPLEIPRFSAETRIISNVNGGSVSGMLPRRRAVALCARKLFTGNVSTFSNEIRTFRETQMCRRSFAIRDALKGKVGSRHS